MNSYLIKVTRADRASSRSIRLSMDSGIEQRERTASRLAEHMGRDCLIQEFIVHEISGRRELISQYTSHALK